MAAPPAKRARIEPPAAAPAPVSDELRPAYLKLSDWFSRYGADTTLEIEARFRRVSQAEFENIKRTLDSCPVWASKTVEVTLDVRFYSGVRQTLQDGKAPVNLAKQQLEKFDFELPDGNSLRINVSAEDACAPPGRDDAPQSFRHKTRFRYCHKGEITYDLTLVRSGATQAAAMAAPPEFEVELEWCGQARAALYPSGAVLAQKFLMKVEDLLRMKRAGAAAAAAAAAGAASSTFAPPGGQFPHPAAAAAPAAGAGGVQRLHGAAAAGTVAGVPGALRPAAAMDDGRRYGGMGGHGAGAGTAALPIASGGPMGRYVAPVPTAAAGAPAADARGVAPPQSLVGSDSAAVGSAAGGGERSSTASGILTGASAVQPAAPPAHTEAHPTSPRGNPTSPPAHATSPVAHATSPRGHPTSPPAHSTSPRMDSHSGVPLASGPVLSQASSAANKPPSLPAEAPAAHPGFHHVAAVGGVAAQTSAGASAAR